MFSLGFADKDQQRPVKSGSCFFSGLSWILMGTAGRHCLLSVDKSDLVEQTKIKSLTIISLSKWGIFVTKRL